MKALKNISVYLVLLAAPLLSHAQQFPQFTQYLYNTIAINPAYAGSREVLVANVLYRNQWTGIEGAPVTETFSTHSSIPGTKLGAGLSIINDELGYEHNINISADISYKLDLDYYDKYKLTFGLKAGFSQYTIDSELLNDPDNNMDPFLNNIDDSWHPNIGVGLYFRGDKFYLGLSSPNLFTYESSSEYASFDRTSLFLNGGLITDLNPNLKFKPSFLIKYTDGSPISFDLATMFLLNDNLWLGVNYRFEDSFGALVNVKIMDGISVGYAYEYITSNLGAYSSGSHEIILNFEFLFPRPRCICENLYN